ncbi:MAG: DUF2510 domain-containing protein [Nitrospinae bacterium]|nr:DUF2510 domain-containing protein [Nitrospinota bacterium]MCH7767923.1 DUF2510 domain-containing protein [Nitrospinota bacterium]
MGEGERGGLSAGATHRWWDGHAWAEHTTRHQGPTSSPHLDQVSGKMATRKIYIPL